MGVMDEKSPWFEMMDKKDECNNLRKLLKELYAFSCSAAASGEKMWCGCDKCNDLSERIEKAIGG